MKNGVINEKWSDQWKMEWLMKNGVIDLKWSAQWKIVIDEKWIGSVIHCCDHLVELVDEKWSDQWKMEWSM